MGGSEVAWPCIVVYAMMMISLMLNTQQIHGALPANTQKLIDEANERGPYLGLVIPNSFEMNPLLQSPNFTSTDLIIDFSGNKRTNIYSFFF